MPGRNQGIDEDTLRSALAANAGRLRQFIDAKLPARLRNTVSVEDVLQDISITALESRSQLRIDRPDAIDRWLTSIAQTRLLNTIKRAMSLKRGGGAPQAEFVAESGSYADLFSYVISPGKTPSSHVASGEAVTALRRALATLPNARREVIVQRFIQGKSCEQIASATNRSEAAVNSLLFHGLRQLQSRLGPAYAYLSDAASVERDPEKKDDPARPT